MKTEYNKIKVETQDELLARILDATSRTKEREAQLKRGKKKEKKHTCDLCPRVAQCTEDDGGIFEHLL
jgi:hypothetical protein